MSDLTIRNNFKVVRYNKSYKSYWNAFVADAKNGTFLFNREFMDYHNDRFIDFSVLVYKGEELYALFPANVVKDKVISHQGLTYGSFV